MYMLRRRKGSQRSMEPIPLQFEINMAGHGGLPTITMYDAEREMYYTLQFDSETEVRELLSQAHIVHHNFEEPK